MRWFNLRRLILHVIPGCGRALTLLKPKLTLEKFSGVTVRDYQKRQRRHNVYHSDLPSISTLVSPVKNHVRYRFHPNYFLFSEYIWGFRPCLLTNDKIISWDKIKIKSSNVDVICNTKKWLGSNVTGDEDYAETVTKKWRRRCLY